MRWKLLIAIVAVVVVAAGSTAVWFKYAPNELPAGLAMSNGRLEAERIDIATKFAGRVLEVLVKEGDSVTAGDILVKLDAAEIETQLNEAKALVRESESRLKQAIALFTQRKSELIFAEQEYERSKSLVADGFISKEQFDQHRSIQAASQGAVDVASAGVEQATAGIEVSLARVERLDSIMSDYVLTAPTGGRVQYQLAQAGEVLGAGGKVLTLLDLSNVYMTLFLPTSQTGQLALGSEARIVPDAAPEYVVPATVSFVASDAQFTPKYVETSSERDKLMYRVKVRILPEVLQRYAQQVKAGITGVAYVKIAPATQWPEFLQVNLPDLQKTGD